MRAESNSLKETVAEQSFLIQRLQCEANKREQNGSSSNFEINGLLSCPAENLIVSVNEWASKLSVPVPQPVDILAVHRLPGRANAIPAVLVRFSSAAIRDTWLSTCGRLRTLRESENVPKVFFNENITPPEQRTVLESKVEA